MTLLLFTLFFSSLSLSSRSRLGDERSWTSSPETTLDVSTYEGTEGEMEKRDTYDDGWMERLRLLHLAGWLSLAGRYLLALYPGLFIFNPWASVLEALGLIA